MWWWVQTFYLLDKESPTNTDCLNLLDVIKQVFQCFKMYFIRHRLCAGKFPDFKEKEEPVSWWERWRDFHHGDVALGRNWVQISIRAIDSEWFWSQTISIPCIFIIYNPYSIHTPSRIHPYFSFFAKLFLYLDGHGALVWGGPPCWGGTDPLLWRLRVHHRRECGAVLAGAEWSGGNRGSWEERVMWQILWTKL